jgi:Domain of unknown function (DUF397)
MSDHVEPPPHWRKASKSGNNGQCVEVARLTDGRVLMRHSHHPQGPILEYSPEEWAAFRDGMDNGEFDFAG